MADDVKAETTKPAAAILTLRERIAARKALPKVVSVPVPGLGTVNVRRLGGIEALAFDDGVDAIAAAILDEHGQPLFATRAEAGEDLALVRAFTAAYNQVNLLPIETAEKN